MNLNAIRSRMKIQRAGLTLEARVGAAHAFAKRLALDPVACCAITGRRKIGAYHAHQGELDLGIAIAWLREQGHTLYLPIIQNDMLVFGLFSGTESLQANQYRIFEPIPDPKTILQPLDLDIALIPLVAFDQYNNRLGMGKGYYDRAFQGRNPSEPPFLIGCGYDFQKISALQPKTHDIKMDLIISTPCKTASKPLASTIKK